MDHNGAGHDCDGSRGGGGYNHSGQGAYTKWEEIQELIAGFFAFLPWLLGIGFFVLMAWLQATGRVH
jgi:hypothetical protein